jgi:hypothetical protein
MEFEFDDDDDIVQTKTSAAPPATDAPKADAPPPETAAPAPPEACAGLLLEFDDDDEIVATSAGGAAKRPREEEPAAAADADFEPAGAYAGSRPGFVFARGAKGLGYYRDVNAPPPKKKKKKKMAVSFAPTEQKVDAAATVKRVCDVLASLATTEALARKGPKALGMLTTLAKTDGGVTETTAPLFMGALRAFAANAAVPDGLAGPMGELVEALGGAPRGAFEVADRVQVATWRLSCACARTLRETDDTYDFCGAMKRVSQAVAALQRDDSDAAVERRDAIIHCLRSAWPHYEAKKWAKTPVEAAVLAAAEKRDVFSDAQRARLDRLTTAVKNSQRGLCRVEKQAVRTEDSTFHPLLHVAAPQ